MKRKLLINFCTASVFVAFMLPWLYTAVGSMNGFVILRSAYNLFDYFTVVSIVVVLFCIFACLYIIGKEQKSSSIVIFTIIGMNAVLCAVDHTAKIVMAETNQLVHRGVGNYVLLVIFSIILTSVLRAPIMKWLDSLNLVQKLKMKKEQSIKTICYVAEGVPLDKLTMTEKFKSKLDFSEYKPK